MFENSIVIITGAVGFIGFHLAKRLLRENPEYHIVGIDNMNDYYDVALKEYRLNELSTYENFRFVKGDVADKETIMRLFDDCNPQIIIHLAAQSGVRYSITNPDAYISSNVTGFYNLLEACRHACDSGCSGVKHFVYASSSSVYGLNRETPFTTVGQTDSPVSLYAATKKADELMTHAYSQLYNIPTTGLHFFTVYGPIGRPDMAYSDAHKQSVSMQLGDMLATYADISDLERQIGFRLSTPLRKGLRNFARWYADYYKKFLNERTMPLDKEHYENNRFRGIKPETEEKYRQAIELYRTTRLSCAEISRTCKVTVSGFQRY